MDTVHMRRSAASFKLVMDGDGSVKFLIYIILDRPIDIDRTVKVQLGHDRDGQKVVGLVWRDGSEMNWLIPELDESWEVRAFLQYEKAGAGGGPLCISLEGEKSEPLPLGSYPALTYPTLGEEWA